MCFAVKTLIEFKLGSDSITPKKIFGVISWCFYEKQTSPISILNFCFLVPTSLTATSTIGNRVGFESFMLNTVNAHSLFSC